MKALAALIAFTAMPFLGSLGCTVPVSDTLEIPVQAINVPSYVLPPGVTTLPAQTIPLGSFSGSFTNPSVDKGIYIDDFAIRSVLSDPGDQTTAAVENASLVDECPAGRANLDFIESISVSIKHKSDPDSTAILVASYTRLPGAATSCGIHLTAQNVDISGYVSDYDFLPTVTGTPPTAGLSFSVGGYVTLTVDAGVSVPTLDQHHD